MLNLQLIAYTSSLSGNLLGGSALSLEDVVNYLRDGVADSNTCRGSRDCLTLLMNEPDELTAFVVGNGNVFLRHWY